MWIFKTVEFLKWLIALTVAVVLFFAVAFLNVTAFPFEGDKEYYLYDASSQARVKQAVTAIEIPFIRGERVELDYESGEILEQILERYTASVVKVEENAGVVSYYCYSPKLKRGIVIDGAVVNLQIAVKAESMVLGTPIIFGGY